MRESFTRSSPTGLSHDEIHRLLHDVAVLASCSNYVGAVTTVEEGALWETALENKVGAFKLKAPVKVQLTEDRDVADDGSLHLAIRAQGQDRGLGARLLVDASMKFVPRPEPTLTMEGSYDVTGRVAALGSSVVRQQAEIMINDFWGSLTEHLVGGDSKGTA